MVSEVGCEVGRESTELVGHAKKPSDAADILAERHVDQSRIFRQIGADVGCVEDVVAKSHLHFAKTH